VIARAFAAVLFDLDDTLHDDTSAYRAAARRVANEVARQRRLDASALYEGYVRAAEGFWEDLTHEHLAVPLRGVRRRMWAEALEACGVHDDALAQGAADAYNAYRPAGLHVFPEVMPLLDGLHAAGCKTALITNGFAETHREKIALLGLQSAFDAVVLADEVGMVKPDPRIFRHACALIGVAPDAAVMVGDRYERDIRGAAEAGLATIWLNRRAESVPQGAPAPDATVETFADVCAALGPTLRCNARIEDAV
jgi:putative hydrolase of the HAD superfamily